MRAWLCVVCVCVGCDEKVPLGGPVRLNAIVLTSMDASKRSGITQSSPLKIPYKSLTERRISSVFTPRRTEISELEELGARSKLVSGDRYGATMFLEVLSAFSSPTPAKVTLPASDPPWENQSIMRSKSTEVLAPRLILTI